MKFRSSLDKYRRGTPLTSAKKAPSVVIESLSNDGDGVAHLDGLAVFVPHTAPGDKVQIEIVERRKRFLRGKVIKLVSAGQHRVAPNCEYVEQCGGCTWQHLEYSFQLRVKAAQLKQTLQRIGKLEDVPARDIVSSPNAYGYRNRIRGVSEDGNFHFHAHRSDALIKVDRCAIAADSINEYLKEPTEPFSKKPQAIELAVDNNVPDTETELVSALPVSDDRTTELGFRQVNNAVSELLTETVSETIGKQLESLPKTNKPRTLLDLYCGHGTWTIRIAERHANLKTVGVDVSEHNIRAARQQAANIKNASFIRNHAEKVLLQADVVRDLVIVDPPRAGLSDEVIVALNEKPSATLLYISCHPATLARDLAKFTQGGYVLEFVQPFDMFPQTAHVETLAVLTLS